MIMSKQGDHLPIVAAIQLFLNANRGSAAIPVTGEFDGRTAAAVRSFQDRCHINPDGIVGPETWRRLAMSCGAEVRDIVDIFDPTIVQMQRVAERVGSRPIVFGGGSNALGWIVPSLAASGVRPGTLALLRILGHGNYGSQVIGYGTGCHVLFQTMRVGQPMPSLHHCAPDQVHATPEEFRQVGQVMEHSGISAWSVTNPEVIEALAPLRNYFAPYGCVEMHGCRVGGGAQGPQLLGRLAELWRVPISGARDKQRTFDAVRYHGAVTTICPDRNDIATWAGRLEPVTMSA
jgi:hypothetical protein